jgi:hypothetical protein
MCDSFGQCEVGVLRELLFRGIFKTSGDEITMFYLHVEIILRTYDGKTVPTFPYKLYGYTAGILSFYFDYITNEVAHYFNESTPEYRDQAPVLLDNVVQKLMFYSCEELEKHQIYTTVEDAK